MATVFLGPIAEGIEAPTLEHVRLRLNFKEFLRRYACILIIYSYSREMTLKCIQVFYIRMKERTLQGCLVFYNRTYEALACEKQHMGAEQEGYHKELMLNYSRIRECLVPLVSSNFRQPPLLQPIESASVYPSQSAGDPLAPFLTAPSSTLYSYVNASDGQQPGTPQMRAPQHVATHSSNASAPTTPGSQRLLRMGVGKSAPPPPIMSPKPNLANRTSVTPRKASEAATPAENRKTSKSNK